jgi:hypothetical protein
VDHIDFISSHAGPAWPIRTLPGSCRSRFRFPASDCYIYSPRSRRTELLFTGRKRGDAKSSISWQRTCRTTLGPVRSRRVYVARSFLIIVSTVKSAVRILYYLQLRGRFRYPGCHNPEPVSTTVTSKPRFFIYLMRRLRWLAKSRI